MLWFIVAVVLFIMYRRARSQNTKEYNRGLRDGHIAAEKKISELDSITPESVRAVFETSEPETSQPMPAFMSEVALTPPASPQGWNEWQGGATEQSPQTPYAFEPEVLAQTPEEIRVEKEQRTLKNLNTLLYVGSFLVVAAMAVFVTLSMSPAVKLASLAAVIAVFYIAGLVLHAKFDRLRPAAVAFVGTGLAILPFFGLALTSLGGMSASVAWFATSVLGIIAYGVAAVRLQSQLVSYLTMAFVISFALSSVSTLGLGMMWYFIVLIGVSFILNTIHYLAPKSVPELFALPVEQTAKIATPVTLIASLSLLSQADIYMYQVLFGLATLQYIVIWLEARLVVYEVAARILGHITVLLIATDVASRIGGSEGSLFFNIVWIAAALLQALYSISRVRTGDPSSLKREATAIGAVFGLLVYQLPSWPMLDDSLGLLTGALAIIGSLAVLVWRRLGQPEWLYLTLGVSVVLPIVIGENIVSPPLEAGVFVAFFTVFAVLALVGLRRAKERGEGAARMARLMSAAAVVYTAMVVIAGVSEGDLLLTAWSTLIAGALMLALSFILRIVRLEVVSAILVIWSIVNWVMWLDISSTWNAAITVLAATTTMLLGAILHQRLGQFERRTLLATIAAIVFAGLVFVGADGSELVRTVAVQLLLAAAVAAVFLRVLTKKYQATAISKIALGMYVAYPLLALSIVPALGNGWMAAMLLISALIAWVSSYIEKQPFVLLIGNFLFVIGLVSFWHALIPDLDSNWIAFSVSWTAGAVFYLTYWYSHQRKDNQRRSISLASALIVLVITATMYGVVPAEQKWVIASVISLLATSVILGVHGHLERRRQLVEVAIYVATFGLQRIVWVLFPELSKVFYAHWWAASIMFVAVWQKQYRERLVVALAFITASTGFHALEHGGLYTILFLVEHLIIAIVGAVLRTQWAMWWGIVATILAVLYFLRDFTVLMLLFLGIVLIAFVISRLLKTDKSGS